MVRIATLKLVSISRTRITSRVLCWHLETRHIRPPLSQRHHGRHQQKRIHLPCIRLSFRPRRPSARHQDQASSRWSIWEVWQLQEWPIWLLLLRFSIQEHQLKAAKNSPKCEYTQNLQVSSGWTKSCWLGGNLNIIHNYFLVGREGRGRSCLGGRSYSTLGTTSKTQLRSLRCYHLPP